MRLSNNLLIKIKKEPYGSFYIKLESSNLLSYGGSEWNRTTDTGIFSPLLYRLSYRAKWRSRRGSDPRSSAWQADVVTTALRDHLVAGRGFGPLTFGLWAQRATRLLHPAINDLIYIINGGGKGIRTPAPLARPPGFQDRSLQPTWVFLQMVPKVGLEPTRGLNLAGF